MPEQPGPAGVLALSSIVLALSSMTIAEFDRSECGMIEGLTNTVSS
jgi:hypothetical protein